MSTLTFIQSQSLRDQALSAIRAGIVVGEIEPGRIYSVPTIAARLGVSATPVREAMLELEAEGLLESIRNKGFRVIPLTDRDLDEIFELRLLLEVPTVGQVAGNLSAEAARALEEEIAIMESATKSDDLTAFLAADRRFHLGLLAQAGNERLVKTVDRLREHARLNGLTGLMRAGQLLETTLEHRRIAEAVVAGDREKAEDLMRTHLRHTRGVWAGVREDSAAQKIQAQQST